MILGRALSLETRGQPLSKHWSLDDAAQIPACFLIILKRMIFIVFEVALQDYLVLIILFLLRDTLRFLLLYYSCLRSLESSGLSQMTCTVSPAHFQTVMEIVGMRVSTLVIRGSTTSTRI